MKRDKLKNTHTSQVLTTLTIIRIGVGALWRLHCCVRGSIDTQDRHGLLAVAAITII